MNIFDRIKQVIMPSTKVVAKTAILPWSEVPEQNVTYSPVEGTSPPAWNQLDYLKAAKGWTYTAINAIAEEVASIKIQLFQKDKEGKLEEIFDSPILDLLYRINDWTTKFDHFFLTQQYLESVGEAPWLVEMKDGVPSNLYLLRPDKLTVKFGTKDNVKLIEKYIYEPTPGDKIDIEPQLIIFLRYPSPIALFRGTGTTEAASKTIELDRYSEDWNANFFYNSARPDALLTTDQKLDDQQKATLKATWDAAFRGVNKVAKVALLEAGLEYHQMQLSQKDMDYLEQQKFSRDKILSIFRVPKPIVAISDDVNLANAETAAYVFARWTIKPKLQRIIEQLNEFFLPLFANSENLVLDFEDPVPENVLQETTEYTAALNPQSGWMTINEVRELEGLPEVEGGDYVLRSFGIMPQAGEDLPEPVEPVPNETPTETPPEETPEEKPEENKFFGFKAKKKFKKVRDFKEQKKYLNSKRDRPMEAIQAEINKIVKKEVFGTKKEVKKLGITDKEMFWKGQIQIEESVEKEIAIVLKQYFNDQEKEVIDSISTKSLDARLRCLDTYNLNEYNKYWGAMIKGVDDMLINVSKDAEKLAKALRPLESDLMIKIGDYSLDQLGSDLVFATSENIKNYLKTVPLQLAKDINKVTNERLRKTLLEGLEARESIPQLSKRVSSVFDDCTKARSVMIARTETARTTNFATTEAYKQSGVVDKKEWLTGLDEVTCFLENTKITTDDGDKNIQDIKTGDLVKTIGGYQKVLKVMKRDYRGLFVGIKTKNGKIIATENHPVWTPSGWKKIVELKIGDTLKTVKNELVKVNGIIHFKFLNTNSNPAILLKQGVTTGILFGVSMPKSTIGFNGDALFSNSKVNTMRANLAFLDKINFQSFKAFTNILFKRCFSSIFTIARKTAKSFFISRRGTNPKFFTTIFASNQIDRSSTYFRTKMSIGSFIRKDFATSFTSFINCLGQSALFTTNSIARGIGFWYRKYFTAHWTNFMDTINKLKSIMTFSATKLLFCPTIQIAQIGMENNATLLAFTSKEFISSNASVFGHTTHSSKNIKNSQVLLATVYNLEVENEHVYYANGLLVHNCERCAELNGKPVGLDESFHSEGESVEQPPLHPMCRCTVVPIVKL